MPTSADFREIVSGRRGGISAALLRQFLSAAETPYTWAVSWRNRRYDLGLAAVERVGVPVVSVGNLTLGGTGKTPLVKWLANWFGHRGFRPAIVSRGYAAGHDGVNDEALELRQSLPDVPHVQNPDRVAAAGAAMEYHGCDLILLDDGFQHRRLARDLDIVLIDALEPFGFDHVFPRGTLREPVTGLRRADVVCLSRADAVAPRDRESIQRRVAELAPDAVWCEVQHAAGGLSNAAHKSAPWDVLRGRRVAAFCGIGNPAGFRHTLSTAGCEIVAWRTFPDHFPYPDATLAPLCEDVERSQADLVVCTQKDLVKIRREEIAGRPLWAVTIEIAFLAGQEALEQALQKVKSRESRVKSQSRTSGP
jgi:tetraacyldisaccharide 4'-kinase